MWCLDLIAYFLTIFEYYLQLATYFGAVELFSTNTIYTGLTMVSFHFTIQRATSLIKFLSFLYIFVMLHEKLLSNLRHNALKKC